MSKDFVISLSGGKDSMLSLYRMIKKSYIPIYGLTTMNGREGRSWFHGLKEDLLYALSNSLSMPIMPIDTTKGDYGVIFENALKKLKEEFDVSICAFGDIDIEEHRNWWQKSLIKTGFEGIWPLWKEERKKLVYEFIDLGFKAKIKVVNTDKLDTSFLGRDFTKELIKELISLGIDPAGEAGEFHTFCYDGPIFKNKIKFNTTKIIKKDNYAMVDFIL